VLVINSIETFGENKYWKFYIIDNKRLSGAKKVFTIISSHVPVAENVIEHKTCVLNVILIITG
jgi:hypothetical protein